MPKRVKRPERVQERSARRTEADGSEQGGLGKSKVWLRQVIDTIPQEIWSGPSDGTIDFCNGRWLSDLGLSLDEIQGDGWQGTLHPEDRGRVLEAWQFSVAHGTPYEQQQRHRMGNGQYRWFLSRGVPLRDEQGRVVRWYGTITDIEGQKRAENALRQQEQRWRAIFDNAYVGMALTDSSWRFVDVNSAYEKMVGYSREELRSMTCLELTCEDDRKAYQKLDEELWGGTREQFEIEKRYVRKDGGIVWVRANGSVLPAHAGEPRLSVVLIEDITDRKRLRDELERDRDLLRLLIDLTHQFIAKLEVPNFIEAVLAGLHERAGWDWTAVLLPESSTDLLKVYMNRGIDDALQTSTIGIGDSVLGEVYRSGQPMTFTEVDFPKLSAKYPNSPLGAEARERGVKGGCILSLVHEGRALGVVFLATRLVREVTTGELGYLQELAKLIAAALNNALRYDELSTSRERLASERDYADEQIRTVCEFENIIGRSKAMRAVLQQVRTVAPTDSAVLILGETGTGKELIARAIHDGSRRKDQAFVKVDCSAIPATLLESELFGHERGAFTGAIAQKLGRLEIADKGTLFLDEIGDLPLELQPKLLRVLQDRAFERLGSHRTVHLDARVIAATSRDLEEMVGKGEFRADLYYRLKVFPIAIPPLRDRPDDIAPLVWHYVHKYAQRLKKTIDTIAAEAMEAFRLYPWPGNVRELQHFMERSVVLTSGSVLQAPVAALEQDSRKRSKGEPPKANRTMEDIERQAILEALRESNWVVGGPTGAARRLWLKRTTLASRIERLGISRASLGHRSHRPMDKRQR